MLENQQPTNSDNTNETGETSEQPLFTEEDVIYRYTRAEAISDGVLIDGNKEPFAEVSAQHYRIPIAMTVGVYAIINKAVKNPRWHNDYKGVWHDILWLSRIYGFPWGGRGNGIFGVYIYGAGRQRYYRFRLAFGLGDDGKPVATIMLPEED